LRPMPDRARVAFDADDIMKPPPIPRDILRTAIVGERLRNSFRVRAELLTIANPGYPDVVGKPWALLRNAFSVSNHLRSEHEPFLRNQQRHPHRASDRRLSQKGFTGQPRVAHEE
jgi:hypothetical protein